MQGTTRLAARRITTAISQSFRTPAPALANKPLTAVPSANIATSSTATTTRFYSAPSNNSKMADNYLQLIKDRRSYYALNKNSPVSSERVLEIVKTAIHYVPSSFNSQSNRVLVLFGADHDKLWDITAETLKAIVPAENWEPTGKKLEAFKAAAGTILFYEDQTVVEGFQERFALYADRFPVWAGHTSAMLQHVLWTTLEAEGLGANLQHYNPLIDQKISAEWKVPVTWKLTAQLVFGGRIPGAGPGEKTFLPIEDIVKVAGDKL